MSVALRDPSTDTLAEVLNRLGGISPAGIHARRGAATRFAVLMALHLFAAVALSNAADEPSGLITSVRGADVQVSLGSIDGVQSGMKLAVVKQGAVLAHIRVTSVGPDHAGGRLIERGALDLVTLGDQVQVERQTSTPAVEAPRVTPDQPRPPTAVPMPPAAQRPAPASAAVAIVRDFDVIITGGAEDGWRDGMLLAIKRSGAEIARARLIRVDDKQSEARLLSQAQGLSVQVGDSVEAATGRGPSLPPPNGEVTSPVRAPTRGPAQHTVPPSDRSYELLAHLAASDLITSVPARVFQQNTVLRRRAGEGYTFTRAKIAELIEEAAQRSGRHEGGGASEAQSLLLLIDDFSVELRAMGTDVGGLRESLRSRGAGAPVGVSGMVQGRLTRKGDGGPDPISEALPVPEGLAGEARLNVFGKLGSRGGFYGQFDASSLPLRQNATVRNAQLRYRLGQVEVEAGRGEFWFGPGEFGTLLHSDVPGGYDYVATRTRRGDFFFEGFSSVVGRDPLRTLHVHRLELTASPNFRLGASESVLRFDDRVSPTHFIGANLPLPLLAIAGGGFGNNEANQLFNFYAEGVSPQGVRVYAEYMIDDLIVKAGDGQNHRLGYLIGGQIFNPRSPHRFQTRLEFASLQPRSYLAFTPPGTGFDSFLRNGQPIGYFLTTNDDRGQGLNALRFDVDWMPKRKISVGGGWELLDQGTGRAFVTRQSNLRFRAIYDFSRDLSVALRTVKSTTTNPSFVNGMIGDRNRVEVEVRKVF